MAEFKIPFTRSRQNYTAQANIDEVNYTFRIKYNRIIDSWEMDIVGVIQGILLVCGVDILAQFKHYSIPQGEMRMVDLEGRGRDASLETFGDSIILTYAEPV